MRVKVRILKSGNPTNFIKLRKDQVREFRYDDKGNVQLRRDDCNCSELILPKDFYEIIEVINT